MKSYAYTVFIGRFQPFHLGHLYNIQQALKISHRIIIIIGSAFRAPSIKNPFSFQLRKQMIMADLSYAKIDLARIIIAPVCDWLYDEKRWKEEVHLQVYQHAATDDLVAIIGHQKDASSYYLKYFPDWPHIAVDNYQGLSATDFRQYYFTESEIPQEYMVANTSDQGAFKALVNFKSTEVFQNLCQEYQMVSAYRKSWQSAPFQPIFVTVDAMVIVNHQMLLIQRKYPPAKDLWALPGGFLEPKERIIDGVLRELFEETQIGVSQQHLQQHHYETCVFDYPDRALIGRVVTHLGLFIIPGVNLPAVAADDDAKMAKWFDLSTICDKMSTQLMDDHYQIIRYMLKKHQLF